MLAAPLASRDLIEAVTGADLTGLAAILDMNPACIQAATQDGHRLLTVAVRSGQARVVLLLLERGANPTWPEANAPRGAALHAAARAGRADLVQALLAHGADPNAHVEASGNAVFAAARFPEVRRALEAHGGSLDPYDLVWLDEDVEVLRRIAADPSSADAGCGGVYTAVVTRGKRELLMQLIEAGVRVPTRPGGCRSYLLEDAEMLHVLLTRGGLDPDYPDESGATLLHALCRDGTPEERRQRARSAAVLLAAGADLGARDGAGRTPEELASRNGLSELLEVLAAARRG